jgi:MFS family permease
MIKMCTPSIKIRMEFAKRVKEFLGIRKNIGVITLASVLRSAGHDFFHPFRPKFYQALGASIPVIGAFNSLEECLEAFSMMLGGYFSDRRGRKFVLLLFGFLAITSYALFALSPTWVWLIPAIVMYGLFFTGWWIAREAVIADSLPRNKRATGYGVVYSIILLVVSPLIVVGGVLVQTYGVIQGVRIAFILAALLYLAGLGLVLKFLKEVVVRKKRMGLPKLRDAYEFLKHLPTSIKLLIAALCMDTLSWMTVSAFLVLYALDVVGITPLEWSSLILAQVVVSGLVMLPGGKLSDRWGRKPFLLLYVGTPAITLMLIAFAKDFLTFLVAFLLLGLASIGGPSINSFVADRTPLRERARVIGLRSAISHLSGIPAPLLGAVLYTFSPPLMFIVASFISFAAFVLMWFLR